MTDELTDEQKAQAEADAAQAAKEAKADQLAARKGSTECRVLFACEHGRANDVVTLEGEALGAAYAAGYVDHTPAAVAYAKSLPKVEA